MVVGKIQFIAKWNESQFVYLMYQSINL